MAGTSIDLKRGSRHRRRGSATAAIVALGLALCGSHSSVRAEAAPAWLDEYRVPAAKLISEATADSFAWRRLSILTDTTGPRLSGSPQLEQAIQWALAEM